MQFINMLDLAEGVDSASTKAAKLTKSAAGALYLPQITARREELAEFTGKDPTKLPAAYREELAKADERHDRYGRALSFLLSFYEALPEATDAQREAAGSVRLAFVPSLEELNASYETEANEARRRRPLLAKYRDALKALPYSGKQTTYGLARKMLDAGDELGALLQKRADAEAKKLPVDTNKLLRVRGSLMRAMTGLRSALRAEVGRNGVTEAAIADVFARLDGQSATREGAASRKRAAAKKRAEKKAPEGKSGEKKDPKA